MTGGVKGGEPSGYAADCFYVLAMYAARGTSLTVADLHEHVAREGSSMGWPVPSRGQVLRALHGLARPDPPLTGQEPPGDGARRWRITEHGYRMLAAWCGDDDETDRVPCGLGWPPAGEIVYSNGCPGGAP